MMLVRRPRAGTKNTIVKVEDTVRVERHDYGKSNDVRGRHDAKVKACC